MSTPRRRPRRRKLTGDPWHKFSSFDETHRDHSAESMHRFEYNHIYSKPDMMKNCLS